MQEELHDIVVPFHWMLELAEVFYGERPDPLDDERVNRAAFMDAFVGNPPFAGKNVLAEIAGPVYMQWLQALHAGAHGNADYCSHFFRRANDLLGTHGTISLIATNTIAQGDTRTTALKPLIQHGLVIYDATRSMPWPGDASVAVSVVHLAKGRLAVLPLSRRLDGSIVDDINSRLRPKPERPDPAPLVANTNCSFIGSYVLGMGFTLTPDERERLLKRAPRNSERIFPYINGREVNATATQRFERYVISFGQMSLEEAERWPDLLGIVREKVKPERDINKRDVRRTYWWRFGEVAPALYEAIRPLKRCIVTALTGKHRCFVFQPTDRILDQTLIVFPFEDYGRLAVLQSRLHAAWSVLLSSSMKEDLRYTPSECFEPFPFPTADRLAALGPVGERLHSSRAEFMVDTNQGLTATYNQLSDPTCGDERVLELRRLHEEMDRTVLAAYGWRDIAVPPYVAPTTDAEKKALETFEDEVIDRLFALNADRAEEEKIRGAGTANGRKRTPKKKSVASEQTAFALGGTPAPPKTRKKKT